MKDEILSAKTRSRWIQRLNAVYCIDASNRIYDQTYDGLEKGRNM